MGLTITGVRVDGLEETEGDPDVHGEDMEVTGDSAVEDRTDDRSGAEDEDFSGVGVFCSKTKRSRIFVVNFMDVLVEATPMKSLVGYKMRVLLENRARIRGNG